jgi:hypothetical protein
MAKDLGKLEDDMGSIESLRGGRSAAGSAGSTRPVATPRPRPDPADANIFTADKGIQPPSPDEGPTRTVKKAKGGSVGSASKRADGIAQRGKTRGRVI